MPLLKEFAKDQLQVRIFDTRKAMGDCAGQEIAQCLRELLKEKKTVNVMFAAAPSQNETLAALIDAKGIDWARINAFHMDEYVGISPSHSASFCNFLNRAIFTKKPFASVNLINASAPDKDAEARRYAGLLESHKLDVCILGIGENGHIAFNDPSVADFNDPKGVKIVKLEEVCRMQQVHDKCFSSLEEVPQYAYTVTIPALLKASHMFCSAPAATKAQAAKAMLEGSISESCPASVLRRHSDARLYLDKDSGALVL
ncbi:MAG: glucosamine-6-phosphate deaminase [Sphaerochaetaceae bacterium]|jgi:glucosamine-6-phosphate deaminase|nr:glucosamine-6-phosphate deaminase [Sphaerochaetaceae bacterium]